jgi:SAM-dependent methyltransferase
MVDVVELEGRLLSHFVVETSGRVRELRAGAAVDLVVDIGSGPGAGTVLLANEFPSARVVAVDGSQAMLDRAQRRIEELGLGTRVETRVVNLPDGLAAESDLAGADLIWAAMVLHHIGNEQHALHALGQTLAPGGLLAIAEFGDSSRWVPNRWFPADTIPGEPGLFDRLDEIGRDWVRQMRADLPGSTESADYPDMLAAAGFELIDDRLVTARLDPPLNAEARRLAVGQLRRIVTQFGERLNADDRRTLELLVDPDDARSVVNRDDVFIESSRRIILARHP